MKKHFSSKKLIEKIFQGWLISSEKKINHQISNRFLFH